jgi:hypothetical protein
MQEEYSESKYYDSHHHRLGRWQRERRLMLLPLQRRDLVIVARRPFWWMRIRIANIKNKTNHLI